MIARADEFESALFAAVIIVITVAWVWWRLRTPIDVSVTGKLAEPCGLTVTQFQIVKDAVRDVAFHALVCRSAPPSSAGLVALYQSINDLCVLCDVDPGRLINGD